MRSHVLRLLFLLALVPAVLRAQNTEAHHLVTTPGRSVTLQLPRGLDVHVVATGIKRARFFAKAPDGRIFVTSMFNLADNNRGAILALDGWDPTAHKYTRITPYLTGLRNPNNLAFWTDPSGQTWLYTALTDKLVRFRYKPGADKPNGPAQVLLRFPDYGLNYKYGGWHLTRTVAFAPLHGRTRLFVAVGSSCNYCKEREAVRASILAMEPDGTHPVIIAHGMRNSVDLQYVPELDGGALFTTGMGDDHLGAELPDDPFFELDSNDHPGPITQTPAPNYGWPTCFFAHGKPTRDTTSLPDNPGANDAAVAERPLETQRIYGKQAANIHGAGTNLAAQVQPQVGPDMGPVPAPLASCEHVPSVYAWFQAHGAPLGFAFFGNESHILRNTFLVALHGPGNGTPANAPYRLVRFTPADHTPRNFLTGFWAPTPKDKYAATGRPCGLLRVGPDSFLLTDDKFGVIFLIEPRK